MADRSFEKKGNTIWVQCVKCDHWFHVSPALIKLNDVKLICPECGNQFFSKEAKDIQKSE
tara:strand:- start:175 stop:354 length:180 start_codon:yes stop_codon:yes gene_type:complete